MQRRMIARVVESSGQVKTDLFPFGQAQTRTQLIPHVFSSAHKVALITLAHLTIFLYGAAKTLQTPDWPGAWDARDKNILVVPMNTIP